MNKITKDTGWKVTTFFDQTYLDAFGYKGMNIFEIAEAEDVLLSWEREVEFEQEPNINDIENLFSKRDRREFTRSIPVLTVKERIGNKVILKKEEVKKI